MQIDDIAALRRDLLDYLGTAAASGNFAAMAELSNVECASAEELIAIAERLGFLQFGE